MGYLTLYSQYIFRMKDPVIVGCRIDHGILKPLAKIYSNKNQFIGYISEIRKNNRVIRMAEPDLDVSITIKTNASLDKIINIFENKQLIFSEEN